MKMMIHDQDLSTARQRKLIISNQEYAIKQTEEMLKSFLGSVSKQIEKMIISYRGWGVEFINKNVGEMLIFHNGALQIANRGKC